MVPRPDDHPAPRPVDAAPGTLASGEPAPPIHPRQASIDEARQAKRRAERAYRDMRSRHDRAVGGVRARAAAGPSSPRSASRSCAASS